MQAPEALKLQHFSSVEEGPNAAHFHLLGYTWAKAVFEWNVGQPLAPMSTSVKAWLEDLKSLAKAAGSTRPLGTGAAGDAQAGMISTALSLATLCSTTKASAFKEGDNQCKAHSIYIVGGNDQGGRGHLPPMARPRQRVCKFSNQSKTSICGCPADLVEPCARDDKHFRFLVVCMLTWFCFLLVPRDLKPLLETCTAQCNLRDTRPLYWEKLSSQNEA